MLADYLPLLAAILLAVAIYWVRERHYRRTRVRPPRPDVTLAEAGEIWSDAQAAPPPPEVLEQARQGLLEMEGLLQLRHQIVREATTVIYLETILQLGEAERTVLLKGYAAGMETLLRNVIDVSTARRQVLREYAHLKYDDVAPEDWFEQYTQVAGPYIREKVRLARAFLLELNEGAERLVEIYDELLRDLEKNLIEARPKKRYPPPDLSAFRPSE